MHRFNTLLLAACLSTAAPLGQANETDSRQAHQPSAEAMIVDGLIVRPLTLAGTLIGTGLFIVTLPFSAAGGNVAEAGNTLVVEPARATFGPCLGCLPSAYDAYDREARTSD